jgi:hypothetical protein
MEKNTPTFKSISIAGSKKAFLDWGKKVKNPNTNKSPTGK